MPEIPRDMMAPVLSLKLMCCQAIAIRFWCNHKCEHFPYVTNNSNQCKKLRNAHRTVKLDVGLRQFISALGVPKTIATDLFEIGLALVPELSKIHPTLTYKHCWCHLRDSSLVSLYPTGGINCKETIQNILKQPRLNLHSKLSIAFEFDIFDRSVADNYEAYIDKISGRRQGSFFSKMESPVSHERVNRIMHLRRLTRTWKSLSQQDKTQFSVIMVRDSYSDELCDFMLENMFTAKLRNFWKLYGSQDPVDQFCFDNQLRHFLNYLASPFCYLHQNFSNLVKELALPDTIFAHILTVMLKRIVLNCEDALYRHWIEIWHGSSEQFKLDFCSKNEQILHSVLYDRGSHNLEFTFRILLSLQPFSPKLKANTSPCFLGKYLSDFCSHNEPFRPPDYYLNKFVGSDYEIAALKRKAIWDYRVRETIVINMRTTECSEIVKDIVQWALVTKKERDEYETALRNNAENFIWIFYYKKCSCDLIP